LAGFKVDMSGRGGAPATADGVAPAANVVNSGTVAWEASAEVMEARGNAVGFVDKSETGTVDKGVVDGAAAMLGPVGVPVAAGAADDWACTSVIATETREIKVRFIVELDARGTGGDRAACEGGG